MPAEIGTGAGMGNPNLEDALRIGRLPFIDALQLHGNESPEFCGRLAEAAIRFAKALPVSDSKSLTDVSAFFTDTVILDSASGDEFGGTGKSFPWKLAGEFVRAHRDLTVILAGGLSAENVADAINQVHPGGVDVTTGVEISPGRKDHRKLEAFIQSAGLAEG